MTTSNNLEGWVRAIFEKHSEEKSPDLELFDTTAIIEELALEITHKEREARIDELLNLNKVGMAVAEKQGTDFEDLSGAYDAQVLQRLADLTTPELKQGDK